MTGPEEDGTTMERDKNGFFKCKECSGSFFSKAVFENHSNQRHSTIELDGAQQTVQKDAGSLSKTIVDEEPLQSNESNKSFETERTIQTHFAAHSSLKDYLSQECNTILASKSQLQDHINTVHEKSHSRLSQEPTSACKTKSALNHHIDNDNEKLKTHQFKQYIR